jgi:hypothetical protein
MLFHRHRHASPPSSRCGSPLDAEIWLARPAFFDARRRGDNSNFAVLGGAQRVDTDDRRHSSNRAVYASGFNSFSNADQLDGGGPLSHLISNVVRAVFG